MPRRPALARRLIDGYQRDMPLEPRPFATMAREVRSTEAAVLEALADLAGAGTLSRVGAVVPPGVLGASTLAAMVVPEERLVDVASLVNAYPEVNHNYEREHAINLWFVVTASDRARVDAVLKEIEARTGIAVLDLPLERPYRIDLGFSVTWN
ncbi:MAG: Lrp/AsnC family transcriptional regulator [Alphaproteobacteria bacterium]|nr:Lrp/AsnC family transcriptional regulator [Alphaproteobacteria bacterium]